MLYRKKGKKEGKKAKKESVLKDAIANAKLWETKLEALEKSRQEYRYHLANACKAHNNN